ncbi:27013_t:CDS:2, partial [Racocetra persica]
ENDQSKKENDQIKRDNEHNQIRKDEDRRAHVSKSSNLPLTNNLTNTKYSEKETLQNAFNAIIDQKIQKGPKFTPLLEALTDEIGLSSSCLRDFYYRKRNPRKTTLDKIKVFVNKERRTNNNLNVLYLH